MMSLSPGNPGSPHKFYLPGSVKRCGQLSSYLFWPPGGHHAPLLLPPGAIRMAEPRGGAFLLPLAKQNPCMARAGVT